MPLQPLLLGYKSPKLYNTSLLVLSFLPSRFFDLDYLLTTACTFWVLLAVFCNIKSLFSRDISTLLWVSVFAPLSFVSSGTYNYWLNTTQLTTIVVIRSFHWRTPISFISTVSDHGWARSTIVASVSTPFSTSTPIPRWWSTPVISTIARIWPVPVAMVPWRSGSWVTVSPAGAALSCVMSLAVTVVAPFMLSAFFCMRTLKRCWLVVPVTFLWPLNRNLKSAHVFAFEFFHSIFSIPFVIIYNKCKRSLLKMGNTNDAVLRFVWYCICRKHRRRLQAQTSLHFLKCLRQISSFISIKSI